MTDVPPGKSFPDPNGEGGLKIYNDDDVPRSFTIQIKKPSEVPGTQLMFGYSPIPKPEYIVHSGRVELGPRSAGLVKLSALVPDVEANYNRKWDAVVVVRQGLEGLGLSLAGHVWLETLGKSVIGPLPKEWNCVLSPATLEFRGNSGEAAVKLHNVSSSALTFLIVSESPPDELRGQFIYNTPGYERLPEEEWVEPIVQGEKPIVRIHQGREVSPMKKVTVAGGKSVDIKVRLKAPVQSAAKGKKWESYIFARCVEMDETRFVRVRILP